ncbi:MAG: sulfatase, partial [Acidobacteriota bacterium]
MKFSKLASLVLCALTLATLGCGRAERLNVLVVTFDTTRADHIASYGNERASTPRVDQLAAEGVLFEHAFSAVPITAPSHSTIMTGKYPLAHGVRDNGMFVLPDNQQTLAETLKANGYATGAAIAAFPLLSRFGVDQGFDFYDDNVEPQPQGVFGDRAFPEAQIYMDERRAGRVNEALFPWLDEHHDKPFFAWAHYFDPHQPFDPPPPYDQLFADDLYLGELAYTDESFGRLLDKLKELGVYDKTIIVLAADHGEGRGEHNELTHSTLVYNTTLHVPLIIRMPGATGGRRVSANAGTVDIVPTVLDLLDLEEPTEVQGESLVPLLEDPTLDTEERNARTAYYAETLAPRLGFGWGE